MYLFLEYSNVKELLGTDFVLYVSDHGHSHGGHGHSHGMGKIPVLKWYMQGRSIARGFIMLKPTKNI